MIYSVSEDLFVISARITQPCASLQNILNLAVLQVQAFVSSTYSLQDRQVAILLKLIFAPSAPKTIEQVLTDKAILQPAPDLTGQLSVLTLLHKVALLIQRMNIDDKNLQWFISNFNSIHTLDFSNLPVQPFAGANQYEQWLNLNKFYQFKNLHRLFGDQSKQPDNSSYFIIR